MKNKTKLMLTIMSMCLVVCLGVFGIFAVKTLSMTVGGNITFNADGIAFEVSDGTFKKTDDTAYTGITTQEGKMQGFAMDTNTKLSDVSDEVATWTWMPEIMFPPPAAGGCGFPGG